MHTALVVASARIGVGSRGVTGMRDDIACPTDKLLPLFSVEAAVRKKTTKSNGTLQRRLICFSRLSQSSRPFGWLKPFGKMTLSELEACVFFLCVAAVLLGGARSEAWARAHAPQKR